MSDGVDLSGCCEERIPRGAAGIDDVVVVLEDSSSEEVLPEVLPDIFLRVSLPPLTIMYNLTR